MDIANFVRSAIKKGEMDLQEQFFVIFVNRAYKVIGYYRHTIGGIDTVPVDAKLVFSVALKCLASGLILAHNHPSGSSQPSFADKEITKELKEVARIMNMKILEHVIVTDDNYFSFADEEILGIPEKVLSEDEKTFVTSVETTLRNHDKQNKRKIEALAASHFIVDRTEIKELTELAIVNIAREIAHSSQTIPHQYERIVRLYNDQIILSHRTSLSILLQQYSTPAPIAFLMGIFCGLHKFNKDQRAFEPSAGNGLLTIAGEPTNFFVNEIDYTRNRNLKTQGFDKVTNYDASQKFDLMAGVFDAVLTNPPFGILDEAVKFDGYPIRVLDHVMAIRALETMKDQGKAAIIIGGHSRWDGQGRLQRGKNRWLFNYLYSHYHVKDVIPIDGRYLYTRQGTGVKVRLILIDGRKQTVQGAAPLKTEKDTTVVKSFDVLFERVMLNYTEPLPKTETMLNIEEIKRKAIELRKRLNGGLSGNYIHENEIDQLWDEWKRLRENYSEFDVLVMEGEKMFYTYDKDVELLQSKIKNIVGSNWKFPDREYLLKSFSKVLWVYHYMPMIKEAGLSVHYITNDKPTNWNEQQQELLKMLKIYNPDIDLGAIYTPASQASTVLDTQVPDSMSFETQAAIAKVRQEVGGSMDNFVRDRLGYPTKTALYNCLAAEQIDAVAMCIYNIEAREQGMIIGDQTGIGKGRVAAAMIRYAVKRGLKPIFITEKANLFSDIYRDLAAIGSAYLNPFIINGKDAKTDVKDEDGEIVYTALSPIEQQKIFESEEIPEEYDYVVATYSQFNSSDKKPTKPNFLRIIAKNNILIMDEAHNSSGAGKTAEFMRSVVYVTLGVTFLSATFAKKPSNMPIYAMKTAISEANLSNEGLVKAILRGGVALQEILSSQLVAEGQMIRRERSFEGIEINYIQLDEYETEHRKAADKITNILRYIIAFQEAYVDKKISEMDKEIAKEGEQIAKRGGTSQAGIDSLPYFSKVFNVINQMLFSIKAKAVADRAIMRLKEGKKPVIAFSSTMGSFIENIELEDGISVKEGDTIRTDFSEVLRKGLEGVLRYTVYDTDGEKRFDAFSVRELGAGAVRDYNHIVEEIDRVSSGISISPIDNIIEKLEAAGYSVGEVTGRKYKIEFDGDTGTIRNRKKVTTNDAFRKFNNNELDVLMINQSGSTGASAHAIVTSKVPIEEVKQRVMIILQAELDINTEVQKRGRINRTGQVLKPIYDYVTSAIPAEKRLMMMLQKKLKSLDANTTSNQKQSTNVFDVPDFLNKYGDKLVAEYLTENPEINKLLGNPLSEGRPIVDGEGESYVAEASEKVSGRVAVLSTKMQAEFYNEMTERYTDYVEYLKQIGEYDLEVEALDLKTSTMESNILKMGKGGDSAFGEDSILEKVQANVLRKPYRSSELQEIITETLAGKTAEQQRDELLSDLTADFQSRISTEIQEIKAYYDVQIADVPNERKIKKLQDEDVDKFLDTIGERKKELERMCQEEIDMVKDGKSGREQYVRRIFNFFTVGRKLDYPIKDSANNETVLAVSAGVVINRKKKNPFARSAVKVKIAIANGLKFITIPVSREDDISKIIATSHDISQNGFGEVLEEWDAEIKMRAKDRGIRYMITGNLLQAFDESDEDGGKLVSYTTQDNQVKKGILMPEDWRPPDLAKQKVTIPIIKGLKLLQSLTLGHSLNASDSLSFIKGHNSYTVVVPAARSKGGAIYMDEEIWPLIVNHKFEIASEKMKATLPEDKIEQLAEILQRKHSISLKVGLNQLALVETERIKTTLRKPIVPPSNENDAESERIRIIKIKAKAVALKLKLRNAA